MEILDTEVPLWFAIPCLAMLAVLGYLAGGMPL